MYVSTFWTFWPRSQQSTRSASTQSAALLLTAQSWSRAVLAARPFKRPPAGRRHTNYNWCWLRTEVNRSELMRPRDQLLSVLASPSELLGKLQQCVVPPRGWAAHWFISSQFQSQWLKEKKKKKQNNIMMNNHFRVRRVLIPSQLASVANM